MEEKGNEVMSKVMIFVAIDNETVFIRHLYLTVQF